MSLNSSKTARVANPIKSHLLQPSEDHKLKLLPSALVQALTIFLSKSDAQPYKAHCQRSFCLYLINVCIYVYCFSILINVYSLVVDYPNGHAHGICRNSCLHSFILVHQKKINVCLCWQRLWCQYWTNSSFLDHVVVVMSIGGWKNDLDILNTFFCLLLLAIYFWNTFLLTIFSLFFLVLFSKCK